MSPRVESTSDLLKSEKDASNRRFTLSTSAVFATGTLFSSAFVPIMAIAGPAEEGCRFSESEEDQADLRAELVDMGPGACDQIELFYGPRDPEDPNDGFFGFGNWIVDEELVIPFGKDLKIFSNDGVVLSVPGSFAFDYKGLGEAVIRHGVGETGYLYENLGTLEIDGIGFLSYGPTLSAVYSNQKLIMNNSAVFGHFLYGFVGHDIEIGNTTIAQSPLTNEEGIPLDDTPIISGVYSLPGLSQDANRSDIIAGDVKLFYNTVATNSAYGQVFGIGMELSSEGNIFTEDQFINQDVNEDISFTTSRLPFHVFNVDTEVFVDPTNVGFGISGLDSLLTGAWGPEFSIEEPVGGQDYFTVSSDTFRSELVINPLRQEWFEDSFNLFELEPGILVTEAAQGPEDSGVFITHTVDRTSRTGISMDQIAFNLDPEQILAPNWLPSFGLTSSSIAARFVTSPLYPQTRDVRGQQRTLPYSAGAVEFDGPFQTGSGSTFGFSPELYDVSPARMASKSGRNITISGPNFPEITEVLVGGKPARIISASASKLVVKAPKRLRGAKDIVVRSNGSELKLIESVFFTTSKSIRGFGDSSSVLNQAMKRQIKKFLKNNPHATSISCQGHASLPTNPRDELFGTARGQAVCDYVLSLKPEIKVTLLSPVVDKRAGATIRRTTLKVIR
jgi:hypothetical protein